MDIGDLRYSNDGQQLLKCLDKSKSHYDIQPGTLYISDETFANCTNLDSIIIPLNVRRIGQLAFSGCSSLKSVTIEGVNTMIGQDAFKDCTGLTSIATVGAEKLLAEIFKCKYKRNVASASITIPNCMRRIDNYAFRGCTGLTVAVIGVNIKEIGNGAFQGCTELNWLNLWEGITTIENYAFEGCNNIKDIRVHSVEPPKCAPDAFLNVCKNSCVLHVPCGAIKAYSTVAVWKDFKIKERCDPSYKVNG